MSAVFCGSCGGTLVIENNDAQTDDELEPEKNVKKKWWKILK
jgi:hypothetical protein